MAVNRGLETFLSVFLLCCWYGTDLQPINSTSGPLTEDALNSTTEDIPEVFDEILAQEILEPNASSAVSETSATTKVSTQTTAQTKDKNMGIDENYQEDGSKNYHELLENVEPSTMSKDKTDNYDRSTVENHHEHSSRTRVEPHFSLNEKKSSNNDKHRKVSVLDRILQNIGRYEDSLELRAAIKKALFDPCHGPPAPISPLLQQSQGKMGRGTIDPERLLRTWGLSALDTAPVETMRREPKVVLKENGYHRRLLTSTLLSALLIIPAALL
ncbi:sperm acrosome-associated protein 7 [Microtus ochrogaster]|uniref:Sperm acrosome-associated protein 7 n=1 Tax=Microtus ochrogaster TaxID=79684 RepID=A0ABM1AV55_MICOH|nr:sperm acrosome-associated protein 7 [Microtus ochrogaster]